MKPDFESAREKYRPKKARFLLIAEAPPKASTGRFFYFEDVSRGDGLFLETMKMLCPADYTSVKERRRRGLVFRGQRREGGLNGVSQSRPAKDRYDWSRLNHLQLARYAEYYAKMEFTLFGFDVYTAEVDDRGIDFVIRRGEDCYYDVQVKSARGFSYIFFPKDKFHPRRGLLAAVALFETGAPPRLYLIPSTVWLEPNSLFCSRDYEGKKSRPEWGLNISRRNMPLLDEYAFDRRVELL